MNETEELSHVSREITSAMRTLAIAGVESARMIQQHKLQKLENQKEQQRQAEQAVRDHRKELLRGAPTQHQQRQWQSDVGTGDAVALEMWDEVYTGTVVTNPNKAGEVSVRFDDPRVQAAYGDVWNKAELHVRKPGNPETKAEAGVQPERVLSAVEQDRQNNIGRGDIVETKDRGNIGTVTTDRDDAGRVAVYFCNKDRGTHFERYFETDELRVTASGDPALKGSSELFSVEGPKGRSIEVTDGPVLDATPKPVIRKPVERPALELVTDEQRQGWQAGIGRGATVKTAHGGVYATVTSNPEAGYVRVLLDEEVNGVQQAAFRVDEVEVVSPGNTDLRTSDEAFVVETSHGHVEISAAGLNSAEAPTVRTFQDGGEVVDAVVDQQRQKASWQENIGRGDTVKALDRGNVGTVTTNPNEVGEVSVHFVNKDKGTEHERGFNVSELEVTRPGDPGLKNSGKAFVVDGSDDAKRTVTKGPVMPDVTVPAKTPVQVRETKISDKDREQAAAKIKAIRSQIVGPRVPGPNTQPQRSAATQPKPGLER